MEDVAVIDGLVCGQTYRNMETEATIPAWRPDEQSSYDGCGNTMSYLHAYRCRQCARWMHGVCLDRHFEGAMSDG